MPILTQGDYLYVEKRFGKESADTMVLNANGPSAKALLARLSYIGVLSILQHADRLKSLGFTVVWETPTLPDSVVTLSCENRKKVFEGGTAYEIIQSAHHIIANSPAHMRVSLEDALLFTLCMKRKQHLTL